MLSGLAGIVPGVPAQPPGGQAGGGKKADGAEERVTAESAG